MTQYVLAKNLPGTFPFASGQLKFYAAGTINPIAVYSDNSGTAYADDGLGVIDIDANGRTSSPIYLDNTKRYKCEIYDSSAVLQNPVYDNIIPQQEGAGDFFWCTDSGSADTYVLTTSESISAYAAGQEFAFEANASNTGGAATVNVKSNGSESIKMQDGSNPPAGAIIAGQIYKLSYDGTNAVLLNPTSVALGLNWYSGLVVTRESAEDLNITAGSIMDSTNSYKITLSADITKQLDATYADGDDAGGASSVNFSGGASPFSTGDDGKVYLVSKSTDTNDTKVVFAKSLANALADTVITAGGYDIGRRIVTWQLASATTWLSATTNGNREYLYNAPVSETISASATRADVSTSVPANHTGIFIYHLRSTRTSFTRGIITNKNQSDIDPDSEGFHVQVDSDGTAFGSDSANLRIQTNSSKQVAHRENSATDTIVFLYTHGWVDILTEDSA